MGRGRDRQRLLSAASLRRRGWDHRFHPSLGDRPTDALPWMATVKERMRKKGKQARVAITREEHRRVARGGRVT